MVQSEPTIWLMDGLFFPVFIYSPSTDRRVAGLVVVVFDQSGSWYAVISPEGRRAFGRFELYLVR